MQCKHDLRSSGAVACRSRDGWIWLEREFYCSLRLALVQVSFYDESAQVCGFKNTPIYIFVLFLFCIIDNIIIVVNIILLSGRVPSSSHCTHEDTPAFTSLNEVSSWNADHKGYLNEVSSFLLYYIQPTATNRTPPVWTNRKSSSSCLDLLASCRVVSCRSVVLYGGYRGATNAEVECQIFQNDRYIDMLRLCIYRFRKHPPPPHLNRPPLLYPFGPFQGLVAGLENITIQ